jgi:hypothetical protein
MKKTIIITLILLVSLLPFIACWPFGDGGDSGDGGDDGYPENVVVIEDDLTEVTTWEGDKVYLILAWNFYVENTLTIEPGAIVKFHPTEGPELLLGGSGTIIANGTEAEPIIFTSYKDDEYGGDTNGDGDATSPARSDWRHISTQGLNGSVFNYCEFYYGGGGSYTSTLEIYDSTTTVTNCTFAHNNGSDYGYGVLDLSSALSGTTVENNVFYDNVRPMAINHNLSLDDSNVFHNPDSPAETNDYNGIYIETVWSNFSGNISWEETEVAFFMDDNDWWIRNGTLTLGNNVVMKFMPSDSRIVIDSTGTISNYNGTGVAFTSYKDDTRKGDTNGDGSITTPSAGDWEGIYDNGTSLYMTWTNIYYDNH